MLPASPEPKPTTSPAANRQRRRATVAFVALQVGFVAVAANWWYEVLRLSSPLLNVLVLLIGLALPFQALVIATRRLVGWRREVALALLVPSLLYGGVFVGFVALHLIGVAADGGTDGSFEPMGEVPVEGGRVRIYRTNCGATCSFGIAVRHERELLPGVLLVRPLPGFYPAHQATFQALGPREVRVSVPASRRSPPDTAMSRVYRVDPGVYF